MILTSHLGRPKGKNDPAFSLAPVGEVLAEHLAMDILLTDSPVGEAAHRLTKEMRDGQVVLLENIRFHPGETKNDDQLARQLASLADCYVNDAFGTAHRAHASTVGVTQFVQDTAAGYTMVKEVESLGRILDSNRLGFVAVLGGAKVSDKIGVIEALLGKVERLLIGGAMAYTFLVARGIDVGASRVESEHVHTAQRILKLATERGVKVGLPVDHVCASTFAADAVAQKVDGSAVPNGLMGLDIGPNTAEAYREVLTDARTVFWNGPMGVFEFDHSHPAPERSRILWENVQGGPLLVVVTLSAL